MATYTDNYNLIKPTYAETADIVPLNNNFEKIDEVMHASQTSLAPAYDQTASYQPGDVVMYELNMYKCIGATSGAWDPSKWTRTTAAETGGGGSVDFDIYGEASGTAEASFSDGAEASLVECEIGIELIQSGSGTPSPSNVRPISGHTDVTVTVASTSGGSGEDTTVSLGRTVYGGTLDVTTGELTVTKGYFDLGELNWIKSLDETYSDIFFSRQDTIKFQGKLISSSYQGYIGSLANMPDYSISATNSQAYLLLRIKDSAKWATMDASEFKTAMSGVQLVYELATPQTFTLTKEQIITLLGQNYVRHDGGGTISLVYVKGDAPIKPNPTGADIPLTGIEIDGEKFKIESGTKQIDVLYENSNGAPFTTTLPLTHNFRDYDIIYIKISDANDITNLGIYNHVSFMPMMVGISGEKISIRALYGDRVTDILFEGATFNVVRASGDVNYLNTVYQIVGIKL